jgi:hypothetical protein
MNPFYIHTRTVIPYVSPLLFTLVSNVATESIGPQYSDAFPTEFEIFFIFPHSKLPNIVKYEDEKTVTFALRLLSASIKYGVIRNAYGRTERNKTSIFRFTVNLVLAPRDALSLVESAPTKIKFIVRHERR